MAGVVASHWRYRIVTSRRPASPRPRRFRSSHGEPLDPPHRHQLPPCQPPLAWVMAAAGRRLRLRGSGSAGAGARFGSAVGSPEPPAPAPGRARRPARIWTCAPTAPLAQHAARAARQALTSQTITLSLAVLLCICLDLCLCLCLSESLRSTSRSATPGPMLLRG